MSPRAWLLFAAVSFLWGIPYLLIRVAVGELSPAVVVFARTALGAALLLPVAWRLGALRGLGGRPRDLVLLSLTAIAIPFTLITAGEQWVSSSLTAILIAAEPMAVALMAIRLDPAERVGGPRLLGMGAGALGLVALLGLDLGGGGLALLGAAMILAAACLYAFASLQVRLRFGGASPLGLAAVTLTISSLVLALPAALTTPERAPSGDVVWSLVLLGVACTALALVLYFALVGEVGAGRATVITYAAPAVAVVLGVAVLDERVGPWTAAGLALIAAGSWLATRGRLAGPVQDSGGLAAN